MRDWRALTAPACTSCGKPVPPELIAELARGVHCPYCSTPIVGAPARQAAKPAPPISIGAGSGLPRAASPAKTLVGQGPAPAAKPVATSPKSGGDAARADAAGFAATMFAYAEPSPAATTPAPAPAKKPPAAPQPAPVARPLAVVPPAAPSKPPAPAAPAKSPAAEASPPPAKPPASVAPLAPAKPEPAAAPQTARPAAVALAVVQPPEPSIAPRPPVAMEALLASPVPEGNRKRRLLLAGAGGAVALVAIIAIAARGKPPTPPARTGKAETPAVVSTAPAPVAVEPAPAAVEPAPPIAAVPEKAPRAAKAPAPASGQAKSERLQDRKGRETHGGAPRSEHKKPSRKVASTQRFDITSRRASARDAYQRGNGLLLAGDVEGAVKAYTEAVKFWPNDAVPYRGLGLAHEKKGNVPAAVAAFRRYLNLARKAPDRDLIARRLQRLQSPQQ